MIEPAAFRALWDEIAPVGRDPDSGGYLRPGFSGPVRELERWFRDRVAAGGGRVDTDGNGNLFAWYGPGAAGRGATSRGATSRGAAGRGDAVLLGSHFDSVPHGGGYDGPLGIVSALLALAEVRRRGTALRRPVAVAAFAEEEGSRFGVPCLGSRLLTGGIDPETAAALTDPAGVTLAEALGGRPAGARPDLLAGLGAFVELHLEQGRALVEQAAPVGVASGIWPHGRWRLELAGTANHAGTTRMADRCDPMLTFAHAVLAAGDAARTHGGHATVGRVLVEPNATNAVPSRVRGWLDARAADRSVLDELVEAVRRSVVARAGRDGTGFALARESLSPAVDFNAALIGRLRALRDGGVPVLPTAAGHDAGVLAPHLPTAMIFVRNPTGVSHSPAEFATDADCARGATLLADALEELACR